MKAITVRLPWAAAIAAGQKFIENRGRATTYRGPIAIHAGAAWSVIGGRDERIQRWWWGPDRDPNAILDATDFSYWFRKVVAVANLVDCHRAAFPIDPDLTCCRPWGERWYGSELAYHLVLADLVRLPAPIAVRGQQGVPWNLPDDVAEQIAAQFPAATR